MAPKRHKNAEISPVAFNGRWLKIKMIQYSARSLRFYM